MLQQHTPRQQQQAPSKQGAPELDLHSPMCSKDLAAFASPLSSCSTSTRVPDSDSEDFLLPEHSRQSSFSEESQESRRTLVTELSVTDGPPRRRRSSLGICNALD